MIGNDVVDLAQSRIESNWQRAGWLQKIFTPVEIGFIRDAACSEIEVWALWSKKEAAYKIYNRLTGNRLFNPLRIESENFGMGKGVVSIGRQKVHVETSWEQDCIHSVAVLSKNQWPKVVTYKIRPDVTIQNGLPFVNLDKGLKACSITHHGRFYRCVYVDA